MKRIIALPFIMELIEKQKESLMIEKNLKELPQKLSITPIITTAIVLVQLIAAYKEFGNRLWETELFAEAPGEKEFAKFITEKLESPDDLLQKLKEKLIQSVDNYKIEEYKKKSSAYSYPDQKISLKYLILYLLNPHIILHPSFPAFLSLSEIPTSNLDALFGFLRIQIDILLLALNQKDPNEIGKLFALTLETKDYPQKTQDTIKKLALSIWGTWIGDNWQSGTPQEIISFVENSANKIEFSQETADLAMQVAKKSVTAEMLQCYLQLMEGQQRADSSLKTLQKNLGISSTQLTDSGKADSKSIGNTPVEFFVELAQQLKEPPPIAQKIWQIISYTESCLPPSPQAQEFITHFKALHPKLLSWENFVSRLKKTAALPSIRQDGPPSTETLSSTQLMHTSDLTPSLAESSGSGSSTSISASPSSLLSAQSLSQTNKPGEATTQSASTSTILTVDSRSNTSVSSVSSLMQPTKTSATKSSHVSSSFTSTHSSSPSTGVDVSVSIQSSEPTPPKSDTLASAVSSGTSSINTSTSSSATTTGVFSPSDSSLVLSTLPAITTSTTSSPSSNPTLTQRLSSISALTKRGSLVGEKAAMFEPQEENKGPPPSLTSSSSSSARSNVAGLKKIIGPLLPPQQQEQDRTSTSIKALAAQAQANAAAAKAAALGASTSSATSSGSTPKKP